ncbi:MAG TPA: lipoate--protein ligase family protein [Bacilli bacterium]|nr:lipoate--protein ligase family protein [Bacilli bacterium]
MSLETAFLQQQWRFIDHSTLGLQWSPLHSFAYDDTFCTAVGKDASSSVLRTWVHENTIVLGIQDSRLPHLKEGVQFLREAGYDVIVRNSGGLAVVLDKNILNLSLIVKETRGLSIDAGYDMMYSLIKAMFSDLPVDIVAKEIVGSYCSGSYDLSIENRKFAGISQRRIRGGVAIQIYLCVDDSGSERAKLIRRFYDIAVQNKPTKYTVPSIQPNTMASLAELLPIDVSVAGLIQRLLMTMKAHGAQLVQSSISEAEQTVFISQLERITVRNERALEE